MMQQSVVPRFLISVSTRSQLFWWACQGFVGVVGCPAFSRELLIFR
jgi:hypothetical protein